FGPKTGWMGGWAIVVADVIVMANLAQIAGQYGFQLIGASGLAASAGWTELAGIIWIAVMTLICYIGIELSARIQVVLLSIELVMLAVLSVTALVKVYSGHGTAGSVRISGSWFNPFAISSFSALTLGLLTAIFIYWGWDTAVSVNEETKDRAQTPGRAAVISTVLLLVTYGLVTVSAQCFAGYGATGTGLANPDNAGDVLSGLGGAVFGTSGFGWFLSKLLVLMVLSSAAASTQTTIMPTARTTLSMAAHRSIPRSFSRIHPRFLTPTWSTVVMGLASIGFYALLAGISANVLADSISSLGLAIAFYYGLTGLACAWHFAPRALAGGSGARTVWLRFLLPLFGALILFAFFFYGAYEFWSPAYGTTSWTMPFPPHWQIGGVFLTGVGSLVLGIPLMYIYRARRPDYFRGQVIKRGDWPPAPEDETPTGDAGSGTGPS
ncbi:APC family permease, partial [Actinospica durhamensis]